MAKILLVIGDELNQDMLSRRLIQRGYEVLIASDGQQALDIVASAAPDLVVMDTFLPDIEGDELTRRLRARPSGASIPIVALAEDSRLENPIPVLSAGCNDYIIKPIDFEWLVQKIEAQLDPGAALPTTGA